MFPITTDVCQKMTAYLKRRLAAKPDGIDAKGVSNENIMQPNAPLPSVRYIYTMHPFSARS